MGIRRHQDDSATYQYRFQDTKIIEATKLSIGFLNTKKIFCLSQVKKYLYVLTNFLNDFLISKP